jgi:hypothetical protein
MMMLGVFEPRGDDFGRRRVALADSGSSCDGVEGLGGDGNGSSSGKAARDAGKETLQG